MTTTTPPPPPPKAAAPKQQKQAVNIVLQKREPVKAAPRICLIGEPGWGKTTLAAHAPDAAIVMARDETGYRTLLGEGRVPNIPEAYVSHWEELLGLLDTLADGEKPKHIAFDALGGFERLCHEYVCQRDFKGDFGKNGFQSYMQGYEVSVAEWLKFLRRMNRLHEAGVGIVLLSHCLVKSFKNPLGPDYDKYIADVHAKTWTPTHKWCDTVLFGRFRTVQDDVVGDDGTRARITSRVVETEQCDAWDAKNRYGMPSQIPIGSDLAGVWQEVAQYIYGKEA